MPPGKPTPQPTEGWWCPCGLTCQPGGEADLDSVARGEAGVKHRESPVLTAIRLRLCSPSQNTLYQCLSSNPWGINGIHDHSLVISPK